MENRNTCQRLVNNKKNSREIGTREEISTVEFPTTYEYIYTTTKKVEEIQ